MISHADHHFAQHIATLLRRVADLHLEAADMIDSDAERVLALTEPPAAVAMKSAVASDDLAEAPLVEEPAATLGDPVQHSMERAGVALLDPGQPTSLKATRLSPSRFEKLTGMRPSEFRAAASLSDLEFEIAVKVGIRAYLDMQAAKAKQAVAPPAGELLQAAE